MKFRLVSIVGMTLIPVSVVCARDRDWGWVYVAPPSPVIVTEAAPAVVVEAQYACPAPGYVWIAGAWEAHRGHWVWIRGRWELPPRGRHVWEAGRWDYRDREHHDRVWLGGHWR